ncbi:MAG: hypothetical protein KUL82_14855 [Bdellovibrio sp.]|nr:hypothetical protein [Bdellovibrio sp.]
MKLLIPLLLTFLSLAAFAGPGDGPIVPWPTSINRQNITSEELIGNWVTFSHNTIWFLEVTPDDGIEGVLYLSLKSNALFNHKATGYVFPDERIFWGDLIMDKNHISRIAIFRDRDGLKLRISSKQDTFHDLKLYRVK